jgi:cystathionine beta-lyase
MTPDPLLAFDTGAMAARRHRLRDATRFVQETTDPLLRTSLPAIQPVSTVFFRDVEELRRHEAAPFDGFFYGGLGTPATEGLEQALARLEGGDRAVAVSTGNGALAIALLAFTRDGHLLVADSAVVSMRYLCEQTLRRFGVEIEYYPPGIGADVVELIRPDTFAIHLESPGSLSFEVQDVPAITGVARARGIVTILDNSWGALGLFPAFEHGVDVSVMSIGKQAGGHADLMLGAIVSRERHATLLKNTAVQLGHMPGALETFLALRGLRSLPVRRAHQERAALQLARWFARQAPVKRVLHPGLPSFAGHALWQRDFAGAAGLLTVAFHATARERVLRALDRLHLTRLGHGWGGTESLALPCLKSPLRQWAPQPADEFWVRLSVGLEDVDDLIEDWQDALGQAG